jgi:hypothetical protein
MHVNVHAFPDSDPFLWPLRKDHRQRKLGAKLVLGYIIHFLPDYIISIPS